MMDDGYLASLTKNSCHTVSSLVFSEMPITVNYLHTHIHLCLIIKTNVHLPQSPIRHSFYNHLLLAQRRYKFIGSVLAHLQPSYREETGGRWEGEKCINIF